MKKGQMELVPLIIGLMVAGVIGIGVVIPVIQTQINTASATTSNTELAVNSSDAVVTSLAYGDLVDNSFSAVSGGVTLTSGNYTVTLGDANTVGTVTWATGGAYNTSNVTYSYYPSTYIQNRTVVTLMQLLPLFLALILLIASVGLVKMNGM